MPARVDSSTLYVQPRQRRVVYEGLAQMPEGGSVKEMLEAFDIPEQELREALRGLDRAGLARRSRTTWNAIPLDQPDDPEA